MPDRLWHQAQCGRCEQAVVPVPGRGFYQFNTTLHLVPHRCPLRVRLRYRWHAWRMRKDSVPVRWR